jgi:hypothetical protein
LVKVPLIEEPILKVLLFMKIPFEEHIFISEFQYEVQ